MLTNPTSKHNSSVRIRYLCGNELNNLFQSQAFPLQSWHLALASTFFLSGEPDYFGRNKISSGGDLSHYTSASLF